MSFTSSLLVEIIGGLVTALVLALIVEWRDAGRSVEATDRELVESQRDLVRWMRDRNRLLDAQRSGIRNGAASAGQTSGGTLNLEAECKRDALQEYRDEITRKMDRARALRAGEGRIHALVRRRRLSPRLALSDAERAILRAWRSDVIAFWDPKSTTSVDDPTSWSLEPAVRRFEILGEPALGSLAEIGAGHKRYSVPVASSPSASEIGVLAEAGVRFEDGHALLSASSPEAARKRVGLILGLAQQHMAEARPA